MSGILQIYSIVFREVDKIIQMFEQILFFYSQKNENQFVMSKFTLNAKR